MGRGSDFSALVDRLTESLGDLLPAAPDLPGHAKVPALQTPCSIESLADWATKKSAETFRPPAPNSPFLRPLLIGYSLGGRIALAAATKNPHLFSGLVLLSASAGISDPATAEKRATEDSQKAAALRASANSSENENSFRSFLEHWWKQPVFSSPRWLPNLYLPFLENRLSADPAALARILEDASPGRQRPLWDFLPQLSLPALFLSGDADKKFCAISRAMAEKCPTASWKKIPGAGHSLLLENPPELATILSDWIRKTILQPSKKTTSHANR